MDYDEHLKRWRNAGIIDEATASSIRDFEARPESAGESNTGRPSLIEALLYLGLVVVAAGVFALLAQNWDELQSPARIAVLVVPSGLALILGFALSTTKDEPFVRGGQMAWLLAVGLVFGAVLVTFNEYGASDDERNGLLVGSLLALGLAIGLWALSGSALQVLGVAASMFTFAQALGTWPDDFSAAIAGTTALIAGATGVALVEIGVFRPRPFAALVMAFVAAAGVYEAGIDGTVVWAEILAFVVAAGLIFLGITRALFAYLFLGVVLAFIALVTVMFEHFESDLGAPVALIVSGGALVACVLLLIPLRRMIASRRHA